MTSKNFAASVLAAFVLANLVSSVNAEPETGTRSTLRVCADPFNLPMSSKETPGYENKIAELIAGEHAANIAIWLASQHARLTRNRVTIRPLVG